MAFIKCHIPLESKVKLSILGKCRWMQDDIQHPSSMFAMLLFRKIFFQLLHYPLETGVYLDIRWGDGVADPF